MHTKPFLVVAGSVRPTRRSLAIAGWVAGLGEAMSAAPFQVIDLRELGLGLDDEPAIPARDRYTQETTRAWGALVSGAAGVVIVSPQYNWGYPAPLKNAIDHLYREWRDKPVLIVTYGSRGGDRCAAQLRQVLEGVRARLTVAMPGLRLARERIEADDGEIDPPRDFETQREAVNEALRELAALSSGA